MFNAEFWKAAGNRALWTFAQTFLVFKGGETANLFEADPWAPVLASLSAAILSVIKSLAVGMPETPGVPPTTTNE